MYKNSRHLPKWPPFWKIAENFVSPRDFFNACEMFLHTAPYLTNKRYVDEKATLCHNYVFSKVEIQWLLSAGTDLVRLLGCTYLTPVYFSLALGNLQNQMQF